VIAIVIYSQLITIFLYYNIVVIILFNLILYSILAANNIIVNADAMLDGVDL